jgi:AcrR family transcriptional regulator
MTQKPYSESKERLLEVARRMFHQRGYNAVSMNDIARELNMRKASLYHHVPNGKEELFVEVSRRQFEEHREGLSEATERADKDIRSQLQAAMSWFVANAPLGLLAMLQSDMPAISDASEALLNFESRRCLWMPLRRIFEEAQTSGEITGGNPDSMTGAFLSLMDGLTYIGTSGRTPETMEQMGVHLLDMILFGLLPREM